MRKLLTLAVELVGTKCRCSIIGAGCAGAIAAAGAAVAVANAVFSDDQREWKILLIVLIGGLGLLGGLTAGAALACWPDHESD